jgi:hypothetical protein
MWASTLYPIQAIEDLCGRLDSNMDTLGAGPGTVERLLNPSWRGRFRAVNSNVIIAQGVGNHIRNCAVGADRPTLSDAPHPERIEGLGRFMCQTLQSAGTSDTPDKT